MTSSERAAFRAALGTKFDYSALIECAWVLSKNYEFLQFSYLTESIMGRAIPMFRVGEGAKEFYYIGRASRRGRDNRARCLCGFSGSLPNWRSGTEH